MAFSWPKTLDLTQALANVTSEFKGDWHKDPWGWPELPWLVTDSPSSVYDRCKSVGARRVATLDVPKENWGTRPAVVLDVVDRLMYQGLVDKLSLPLIGGLLPDVFGWRLHPTSPERGTYGSNKIQWDAYRNRLKALASVNSVALKSDIVSFFASITIDVVGAAIEDRVQPSPVSARIVDFLEGSQRPTRTGLPQRSLASSVLANLVMAPIDDTLANYKSSPDLKGTVWEAFGPGFTRWMDDIWLFLDDAAEARKAQRDLQHAAASVELHLNSAKTDLLEGDDVAAQALVVEHSAVDEAILDNSDFGKLQEMVDRIVEDPDHVGRTSVKFAISRMLKHKSDYRVDDLLEVSPRMPHVADALSALFKKRKPSGLMQDWFQEYCEGDWSQFPWAIAQYGRMFTSGTKPRRTTRELFMEWMSDVDTELPLLSISAQRLAAWDPPQCRTLASDAMRRTQDPQARRVLALAALSAGMQRRTVRRWLAAEPENRVTLDFLAAASFRPPTVRRTFAR